MLTKEDVRDICLRLKFDVETAVFEHAKLGRFTVYWSHTDRFQIQIMGTTFVIAHGMSVRNHSLVFTDDHHETILSMGLCEVELKCFVPE